MSGPTWLPPRQLEPARAPQGRALPRGAPGPPPAHGAGKAAPVPPRRPLAILSSPSPSGSCLLPLACPCHPFPEALPASCSALGLQVGGGGRGEEGPMRAASISVTLPSFPIPTLALFSLTLAHQPHPRVNFCPLPSEQCYQAPGGPDDRGFPWVGCHGAPQRSQVRIGIGGG